MQFLQDFLTASKEWIKRRDISDLPSFSFARIWWGIGCRVFGAFCRGSSDSWKHWRYTRLSTPLLHSGKQSISGRCFILPHKINIDNRA